MKRFAVTVSLVVGTASLLGAPPESVGPLNAQLLRDSRFRIVQTLDESHDRVVARCPALAIGNFAIFTSRACLSERWTNNARYSVRYTYSANQNEKQYNGTFVKAHLGDTGTSWAVLETSGHPGFFDVRPLERSWTATAPYHFYGFSSKVEGGKVLAVQSGCHILSHPAAGLFASDCGGDFDGSGFLILDLSQRGAFLGIGRSVGREKAGEATVYKLSVDSESYARTVDALTSDQRARYGALLAFKYPTEHMSDVNSNPTSRSATPAAPQAGLLPTGRPGAGTSATTSLPSLGTCGLTPNYADGMNLSRFRGSEAGLALPVQIVVDRGLPRLSRKAAELYEQTAQAAVSVWQEAIDRRPNGPRIRFHFTDDPSAPVKIILANEVRVQREDGTAQEARTVRDIRNDGGHRVISWATIWVNRGTTDSIDDLESALALGGAPAEREFRYYLARVVAHEVGHALGLEHAPTTGHIMTVGFKQARRDYEVHNWISDADINTVSQSYCAGGASR